MLPSVYHTRKGICERPAAFESRPQKAVCLSVCPKHHVRKTSPCTPQGIYSSLSAFHPVGVHKRVLNIPSLYASNSFLLVSKKEKQTCNKSKLNRGKDMKQFTMTRQKILPGSPKSCPSMLPRIANYVSLIFW